MMVNDGGSDPHFGSSHFLLPHLTLSLPWVGYCLASTLPSELYGYPLKYPNWVPSLVLESRCCLSCLVKISHCLPSSTLLCLNPAKPSSNQIMIKCHDSPRTQPQCILYISEVS
eukprot:TRINITY_DN1558_c0_g1_i37.p2 TRINITY_DN1558_c0_g1~~TRINITY_DN1558_c0_g1_i37.p2  ORF type:complete len:114 (-),score=13.67 TRINITY_DN1558_c0_g1_i37:1394-1735(-)